MSSPRASTSTYVSSPSSSEDAQSASKRKKTSKSYAQKYNLQWEQQPEFKGWLQSSRRGPTFAHCKACNKDFVCGKSEIIKHSQGKLHAKLVVSISKQKSLTEMSLFTKQVSLEKKIKTAEIRIAAFAAEHNIAFNTLDHLSEIIKISFTDSEIAKNYTNNRTKATALVNNVIGAYGFDQTIELLRSNKFSLIVDESTDKGSIKHLALVVRVFTRKGINDLYFGLLQLPSGTAEALYTEVTEYFAKCNINYKKNLMGFASDGASAMMGIHNSLSTKLKADIPDLFIMKCICHSFSLCANYACEKLPNFVEELARDVYSYFQHSYKRQFEFKEFQQFVAAKPQKLLQPSQTRWLSLLEVVKRLNEQYKALKLYFTEASLVEKTAAAQNILPRLQDPSTELYLCFLEFILPYFTNLNLEMQAESIKVHTLYKSVEHVLRSILDCYLKKSYLDATPIENIQHRNPHNFVEIENIYLGAKVMGMISNNTQRLNRVDLLNFRQRCLDFLIEGCSQIYKRFDSKGKSTAILKQLSIISPAEVISKKHISIAPLSINFPSLTNDNTQLEDLDREWRILRNADLTDFNGLNVMDFWLKVLDLKFGDDTPMCPTLCNFIFNIFSLPHSSATVERIFSTVNLNKTKIRNKLSTETLNGILHTKTLMKNSSCYEFDISNDLIKKFDSKIYKTKAAG